MVSAKDCALAWVGICASKSFSRKLYVANCISPPDVLVSRICVIWVNAVISRTEPAPVPPGN
ncbi:hypothetical protein D3C85_1047730 [compost metagenome]